MENKTETNSERTNLETKVKFWTKMVNKSWIPSVACVVLAAGLPFYCLMMPKPKDYAAYNTLSQTKFILENKVGALSKLSKDPESNLEVYNIFKKNYLNGMDGAKKYLNDFIKDIETNMKVIKETPEFKAYDKKNSKILKGYLGSLFLVGLSIGGITFCDKNATKYKKRLETLKD